MSDPGNKAGRPRQGKTARLVQGPFYVPQGELEGSALEILEAGGGCAVDGRIVMRGVIDGVNSQHTLKHPGQVSVPPGFYEPADRAWPQTAANGSTDDLLALLPEWSVAMQGWPGLKVFTSRERYLRLVEASAAGRFSWGSE